MACWCCLALASELCRCVVLVSVSVCCVPLACPWLTSAGNTQAARLTAFLSNAHAGQNLECRDQNLVISHDIRDHGSRRGVAGSRCVIAVGIRPWPGSRMPPPTETADQGREVVLYPAVETLPTKVMSITDSTQEQEQSPLSRFKMALLSSSRRDEPDPLSSPVLFNMPPPTTVEAARARLHHIYIIQIIKQERRTERVSCGGPTQCIQNGPRKSQPRNARPAQSRVKM